MNNWMEEFEKRKDDRRERELNIKLEELLNLLDEEYRNKQKLKLLKKIVDIYDELRIDACDYNEKDYKAKKQELSKIIYEIKEQEYKKSKEAQSWNEYKEEEQRQEIEEEDFDR